ncbi:hypothetical protein ACFVSW_03695 [Neobacillus sp. NPDC058068]|uniref:hypothetical protein n=1 Tax=Neobacillus sp. NPDC058068 TaxID=3346325 RepID=UPI0036D886A0
MEEQEGESLEREDELEIDDLEEHKSEDKVELDPFTALMFGRRRGHPHHVQNQEQVNNQTNINYEELMMHIDTLWESVQELKPLFQQVYPFIQQIWKKK